MKLSSMLVDGANDICEQFGRLSGPDAQTIEGAPPNQSQTVPHGGFDKSPTQEGGVDRYCRNTMATEEATNMDEEITSCPYCLLGDQPRPMLQRPAWFICENCGHTVIPDDPDFKCSCGNCGKLKEVA